MASRCVNVSSVLVYLGWRHASEQEGKVIISAMPLVIQEEVEVISHRDELTPLELEPSTPVAAPEPQGRPVDTAYVWAMPHLGRRVTWQAIL
jgi:hypothetical protein